MLNLTNRFFIISRYDPNADVTMTEYFRDFKHSFDANEQTEEYGSEIWDEKPARGAEFETYAEAKAWLDAIMQNNSSDYVYEITCYRHFCEELDKGYWSDPIPLKTFWTSQNA